MTHYMRLMGQKETTSLGDFPGLSDGMIVATLQIRGQWASENDNVAIGMWHIEFAVKMLALDLISVMVRASWDIALLGELALGVPFRPWITFHMFGMSELDIASWRILFQLSVLDSLIASVAGRQASIHCCCFWCIVRQRRFQMRILARTWGVFQGLDFLLGLDFPTWAVAAEMRIPMMQEIQRDS